MDKKDPNWGVRYLGTAVLQIRNLKKRPKMNQKNIPLWVLYMTQIGDLDNPKMVKIIIHFGYTMRCRMGMLLFSDQSIKYSQNG